MDPEMGQPIESAGGIGIEDSPVETAAAAPPSSMLDAVVLELPLFSMASKPNNARDPALWNKLWALVSARVV